MDWLGLSTSSADGSYTISKKRTVVLVVEDDASFRSVVKAILEKEGFEILEAVDGIEGLRVLQDAGTNVDLLLTDLNMPGMDGLALVTAGRKLRGDLPILLMSGQMSRLLDPPGNVCTIRKPFRRDALVKAVRKQISHGPGPNGRDMPATRVELKEQLRKAEEV